jgi:ferredoxin
MHCRPLTNAYTPSFGLMGHESLIMQQSDIGAIADSVKDCLRCGKCKPVCATHVPRANLLYSPRNKILATSLLVEAFLYEEQTRRGVSPSSTGKSSKTWPTTARCATSAKPLPGEDRLWRCVHEHAQPAAQDGPEELPPRQAAAMAMLNATSPRPSSCMRTAMVAWASRPSAWPTCAARVGRKQTQAPPATVGTARSRSR